MNIEKKVVGKTHAKGEVGTVHDFCSVVETVTFGIRDGHSFSLMSANWTPEDRVEWAKAHVLFFQGFMERVENWGKLVAKENGVKY